MTFPKMIEDIPTISRALGIFRFGVCVLYVCSVCCASAMQADTNQSGGHRVRPPLENKSAAATRHKKALTTKTSIPVSPAGANAIPANVVLTKGSLTVEANNSDLSQILGKIADVSGMTIDGAVKSVRVYGIYGPSNPRSVLTDLLMGLGYNFMMVGVTDDGVPRKLELTLRSGDAAPGSPTPTSVVADHHENTDVTAPGEEQPGPGAILNVPPAGPEDPQERTRQNLQRLQQMHDLQKPQNAPQ